MANKKWVHRHRRVKFDAQYLAVRALTGCHNPNGTARDRLNFMLVTSRR